MESKHTNSNSEIALPIKIKLVEIFVLKNVKIKFKNESYTLFFLRCSNCPQNKMLHNFHITNPNGMNQSFFVNKNTINEKQKQTILISIFCDFF